MKLEKKSIEFAESVSRWLDRKIGKPLLRSECDELAIMHQAAIDAAIAKEKEYLVAMARDEAWVSLLSLATQIIR